MGYGATVHLTAIGDTVNVASRLQDLTKEFACQLVISEEVARQAGLNVSGLPRHEITVRNRREALAIFAIDDLKGLVIGVQKGNTSQPVADKLVAEKRAAGVKVYAYDEIETALGDLSTGGCDAFMKLAPVTHWFVRDRPRLAVVQTGITRELLGVCVRKGDTALRDAIDAAQAALARDGTLGALIKQWLGEGATAPS